MRRVIASSVSTLALVMLAGCGSNDEPLPVSASPPTISYRIPGNDVSTANARAADYCRRYNLGAQLQSVQPQGSEGVAYYACAGTPVASAAPIYNAPPQTYATQPAPADDVQCADFFHQDRPGGSDYHGPAVPRCPQR